jgi:hypothetical protein
MNTYQFHTAVRCPKDHRPCQYLVRVRATRLIWTEDIEAADAELRAEELSQEKYTRRLSRMLGARVETEGQHGDFCITCVEGVL